RIDVPASCYDATLVSSSPGDHVHQKHLRRADTLVCGRRWGRLRIMKVRLRSKIHQHANFRRPDMARYGDGLGELQPNHLLLTEWGRKCPPASWRRIVERQLAFRKDEAPPGVSLTCQPRSSGRPPSVECDGDADLVCAVPVTHGGRGHQIAKSTKERHRRHDDSAS